MSVNHCARSEGIIGISFNRDIFSIFFNMKVCCVFLLESPHRGDSNKDTQYTIIIIKKIHRLSQIASHWILSLGFKNEFEIAVVNEPSVFEPLKFYCRTVEMRHTCLTPLLF